ncbi:hypothetical protein MLAC_00840 [Mycobacterium lacus]|uniref:Uncharacterized protein n=1 Tax=Mycobacterium lacus TaxID=169765 RepID=A0A7I7NE34_9MYCO|nr:hypothetical protein MLAC_00840 [Mycobacterium lacus]
MSVGGALSGMPRDRAKQRIDIDERAYIGAGQLSAVTQFPRFEGLSVTEFPTLAVR